MSIHVNKNFASMGTTAIFVDNASASIFAELVHRATNLWPDAPPEIKSFADEITSGKVHQRYAEQATDKFRNAPKYHHQHQCSCGYITIVATLEPSPPDYGIKCNNNCIVVKLPGGKEKTVPCKRMEPFKQYYRSDSDSDN